MENQEQQPTEVPASDTPAQSASVNPFLVPVAILLAGVFIAGALFFRSNSGTPQSGNQQKPSAQAADISKVKFDGEPFIGKTDAPVTIAYWYDYQCPFCNRHEEQTLPQIIKEYVDTGKVRIVFKDFQFLGPDSQTLGKYSRAVWEIAPDKFYAWHKAVYDNQGQENSNWATQEKILSITKSVLSDAQIEQVVKLVKANGDEYQKEMDADRAEGAAMGVNGTPGTVIGTQLIEGAQPYQAFKSAIDAALAAK